MKSSDTRTLLVERRGGEEFQVDIPSGWKVTFGPLAVSNGPKTGNGPQMPMALRLYESDNCQRAVFTDVVSFRDMSIPMRMKKVNVQEKHGVIEFDGVRKATTFQATSVDWINPDNTDQPKQLERPTDAEMFNETEE